MGVNKSSNRIFDAISFDAVGWSDSPKVPRCVCLDGFHARRDGGNTQQSGIV